MGWYGSAYLLTTASFQLLFGKFYTYFSIKWVYLAAIGIFEVGSVVCGAAPNSVGMVHPTPCTADLSPLLPFYLHGY